MNIINLPIKNKTTILEKERLTGACLNRINGLLHELDRFKELDGITNLIDELKITVIKLTTDINY